MPKPNGLFQRKGSSAWYFRRRFPAEVAARSGRKEFLKSLRTGLYHEAVKLLPKAQEDYLAELKRLTAPPPSQSPPLIRQIAEHSVRNLDPLLPALGSEAAERIARQFFGEQVAALDRESLGWRAGDGWEIEVADAQHDLACLSDPDDPNCCRWVEATEIAVLNSHALRAAPHEEASIRLRSQLRRALWQIARLRLSRLHGDYSDVITDKLFASGTSKSIAPPPAVGSTTLAKLIELYEHEHIDPEEFSEKTANKHRAALKVISRYFGPNKLLRDIDREQCFAFRDTLAQLPPNFTKLYASECDLRAIAAQTSGESNLLNRQTQEHYLRVFSKLLGLAVDRRLVPNNCAEGIKPRGRSGRKEAARQSYSLDQLRAIFSAPIYTGCVDDERGFAKPGPNVPRRGRFWMPLLALFTGVRMNEILQLTVEHVLFDEANAPYFFISPDMKVKTENGYRYVPVHHELLKIGFMSLLEEAKDSDSRLLIRDVASGSDGYRSSIFSKRYATFSKSLGLGDGVTFHSFRHTFRDALRKPHINPDLINELGGWSRGSKTSTSYGNGAAVDDLRPLIDAIDYKLDLRRLYATS